MSDTDTPFARVIVAIDAVNAADPNLVNVDGWWLPAELVYGRRMSATLARLHPDPPETMRIAARGQHIERWMVPRLQYPAGRAGYLAWRKFQRNHQAGRLAELMEEAGYGRADIDAVGALIRKQASGPESQLFEDVICVMFFEHCLRGFMAKTGDEDKLASILGKTWKRMSAHGHRHALALNLPARAPALIERGLVRLAAESIRP